MFQVSGFLEARKLETFNVSIFRPLGSEFERQNLMFCSFKLLAKIPTFAKVGILSISIGLAYYPPETEFPNLGHQRPAGQDFCSLS
jgi:hypothetical protein